MKIPYIIAVSHESTTGDNSFSIGEWLSNGGVNTLLIILCAIAAVLVIWLAALSYKLYGEKSANSKEQSASASAVQTSDTKQVNDDVTIAVITAALAAYLSSQSEDGTYTPFRVVSFKRRSKGSPWNSDNKF